MALHHPFALASGSRKSFSAYQYKAACRTCGTTADRFTFRCGEHLSPQCDCGCFPPSRGGASCANPEGAVRYGISGLHVS
jgi:hypothetical protein